MISRLLTVVALIVLLIQFAFGQVEENSVDFTISPSVLQQGKIHVAYEWLTPGEFRKTQVSIIDLMKVKDMSPGQNQIVASKLAFTTKKSFDELSFAKLNTADYISNMLNSVGVIQKSANSWRVTNKVKAYGLPFKVSFDFDFKEVSPSSIPAATLNYLKDEASVFKSSGRERVLILDMSKFTQLIYRNYSIVYMKEISNNETLIVSGVVAGIDIDKANGYFNYPPISRTETTLMNNLRRQILHMAREIQN